MNSMNTKESFNTRTRRGFKEADINSLGGFSFGLIGKRSGTEDNLEPLDVVNTALNTQEKKSSRSADEEYLKKIGGFSFGHVGKRSPFRWGKNLDLLRENAKTRTRGEIEVLDMKDFILVPCKRNVLCNSDLEMNNEHDGKDDYYKMDDYSYLPASVVDPSLLFRR